MRFMRPSMCACCAMNCGGRGLPALALESQAEDRATYLRRPDLGRALSEESAALLNPGTYDVVFVIADGLSALAVERHALQLLRAILPLIPGWRLAPVCVVEQGRVAVGDAIGEALHARLAVVLIGERPGLSSPDSLGVYITWDPRRGRKDAERNCISNIREEGLGYAAAASRLHYYMDEASRRQMTGLGLRILLRMWPGCFIRYSGRAADCQMSPPGFAAPYRETADPSPSLLMTNGGHPSPLKPKYGLTRFPATLSGNTRVCAFH